MIKFGLDTKGNRHPVGEFVGFDGEIDDGATTAAVAAPGVSGLVPEDAGDAREAVARVTRVLRRGHNLVQARGVVPLDSAGRRRDEPRRRLPRSRGADLQVLRQVVELRATRDGRDTG